MTSTTQRKWCELCQKATHNDAECWRTREVRPPGYKPLPFMWPPFGAQSQSECTCPAKDMPFGRCCKAPRK